MSPAQVGNALETAAAHAARRAASYLAELQAHDGHWCAELTADTTLESDYILFQLWLYPPVAGNWDPPTRPLIDKAVRSILARQLADGGFNIYVDGPAEISASVKAYFALKLAGVDADGESMRAAAGADSGAGRDSIGQQLRKGQPEPVRSVSAAVYSFDSTRGGVVAGEVPVPDVGVVAGHRAAARESCMLRTRASRFRPDSTWASCGLRA